MSKIDLSHSVDDISYTQANGKLYPTPQMAVKKEEFSYSSYVLPRTQVDSSVFTQAGVSTELEFSIGDNTSGKVPDYATCMFLEFTLQNVGAAVMNLMDGFAFWERYSLSLNEIVVSEYWSFVRKNELLMLTDSEHLASTVGPAGINVGNYGGDINIAAGATRIVRIPLFNLLDRAEWPLFVKSVVPKLKFFIRGGSQLLRTGSPAPITDLRVLPGTIRLVVKGPLLSAKLKALNLRELYDGRKRTYSYIENTFNQQNISGITTDIPTTVNWTCLGNVCNYYLHLQSPAASGDAIYDSYILKSFEAISSGQPVAHSLNDNGYTVDYYKSTLPFYITNTSVPLQRPIYFETFSPKMKEDILYGSSNGAYPINNVNSEQIRFVPAQTVATPVQVNIYSNVHSQIEVNFATGTVDVIRKTV